MRQGFEVHLASATNLYWHDALPFHRGHHWIVATHDEAIRQGATGGFNCNWEFYRGQIPDNFWYFQGLVAERTWTDAPHEYASWARRFSSRFWGLRGDEFAELAGLIETVPTGRKVYFLDKQVLDCQIPAALNPLWPDWRQTVFDHAETGDYVIAQARRIRRAARRNADTLRMLDMPGEIVRYQGVRARQWALIEAALKRGDKRAVVRSLATVRAAAQRIARRLAEGYRVYGTAVQDRGRIARHLAEVEACLRLVRRTPAGRLRRLTMKKLMQVRATHPPRR